MPVPPGYEVFAEADAQSSTPAEGESWKTNKRLGGREGEGVTDSENNDSKIAGVRTHIYLFASRNIYL